MLSMELPTEEGEAIEKILNSAPGRNAVITFQVAERVFADLSNRGLVINDENIRRALDQID